MDTVSKSWFLADDFSGALEVGAVWCKSGHAVEVGFDSELACGQDVFGGISSETRDATPAEAKDRLSRTLEEAGERVLAFKKIDSTLRGPVGAELATVSKRWPERPILLAPTNPEADRTVCSGMLYVGGRRVSQTEFAADPTSPVVEDRISRLIAATDGPESSEIGLNPTDASVSEMSDKLAAAWVSNRIAIVDAVTHADLDKWVAAAKLTDPSFLPCGSGGLARAIDAAGLLPSSEGARRASISRKGRVLFVVGSVHPTSRAQMDYAQNRLGITVESLSEKFVEAGTDARMPMVERIAWRLDEQGAVGLVSEAPLAGSVIDVALAKRTADCLGELSGELLGRGVVDALFVTGGETARAVMDAVACRRLSLEGELLPGVAIATMPDTSDSKATLLVKPGGFGAVKLFEQVVAEFGRPQKVKH